MEKMLVEQCIALSWFRCLMEEGYDFVNKLTGEVEKNEMTIYKSFQQNAGLFDMPAAKCSPKGLEKNLFEVIGTLVVYNKNTTVSNVLQSEVFTKAIQEHIEKIRAREFSGKI